MTTKPSTFMGEHANNLRRRADLNTVLAFFEDKRGNAENAMKLRDKATALMREAKLYDQASWLLLNADI